MKLNASTQNVFAMNTTLPLVGQWEQGGTRRASFTIRPFSFEDAQPTVRERDDLARKQETICAVILGLCLLFTLVFCFIQLSHL